MPHIDPAEIQRWITQAEQDEARAENPEETDELTADEIVKRARNSNYDN